ncbi:phosphoglycolate phosphatase [Conservatibacter flavescens]|uniref:Phosphoglycolate phosphatase n=1 Tax=Conservatibacter flavescens TaxID=28161 RepID=A0A2M8S4R4_9PAST|nr:phosphoglycolate phosphatase [Conservatibacter flavescens]PJG86140.1 phosphoglycolate phosphatase [Conservatibacter flavescens]
MTSQFKLIGFDLDGTLVDSLPDLALSVNSALAELGLPQAPEALVMTWIGNGADILSARALDWACAQADNRALSDEEVKHFKRRFGFYYGENICNISRLYPNVKETLEKLHAAGYALAVVTNKPTKHVQPVLAAFGIDHLFCEMLGGQSLPAIKPHPAPLYYLCGKFGLYPKQILFVGDSKNDILAAHAAGCAAVGLTYGYNYNIPIAESCPDWVFDDFADILSVVR